MKLFFKNKMSMALGAMCDEGKKKGGILKHITLSRSEATDIFHEIRALQNDNVDQHSPVSLPVATSYDVQPAKGLEDLQDSGHPVFLIKMLIGTNTRSLNPQTTEMLLDMWSRGDIQLSFRNIPLIPETSAKPEGPKCDVSPFP